MTQHRRPPEDRSTSARPQCNRLEVLDQSPYYHLLLDHSCRLLVAQRTPNSFASKADILDCFDAIDRLLSVIPRADYCLLGDVRFGPARNDPEFEDVIQKVRGKLLFGFSRNAALCLSAVGKLQIQRYANADGRNVLITDSPKAAFEHLQVCFHELPIPQ